MLFSMTPVLETLGPAATGAATCLKPPLAGPGAAAGVAGSLEPRPDPGLAKGPEPLATTSCARAVAVDAPNFSIYDLNVEPRHVFRSGAKSVARCHCPIPHLALNLMGTHSERLKAAGAYGHYEIPFTPRPPAMFHATTGCNWSGAALVAVFRLGATSGPPTDACDWQATNPGRYGEWLSEATNQSKPGQAEPGPTPGLTPEQ